jgi:hypothetical protein
MWAMGCMSVFPAGSGRNAVLWRCLMFVAFIN